MADIQTPKTYVDVIDAFGGTPRFRDETGINYGHARQMRVRDSIAPGYWPQIVEAARRIGRTDITYELLARIAQAKLPAATEEKVA